MEKLFTFKFVALSLGHRENATAHAEANTACSKETSVANTTVDFAVGRIAEIGRVEGSVAVGAVEAAFVPRLVLADHFLGLVDDIAAA